MFDDRALGPLRVLPTRPSNTSLIMRQRSRLETLPNRFGYVTVEISNVGMAPAGIAMLNWRVYSTWAHSGVEGCIDGGKDTWNELGSEARTTDDPEAAYS